MAVEPGQDALFIKNLAAVAATLEVPFAAGPDALPDRELVGRLVGRLAHLLFPHHLPPPHPGPGRRRDSIFWQVTEAFWELTYALHAVSAHPCPGAARCEGLASQAGRARALLAALVALREELEADADAAFRGDPAAESRDEIIATYPGLLAVLVYRLAHSLYELEVDLLPRMMTEWAHGRTGIDIHPKARIGPRFFIDHGTGVVIGETTTIGAGVTLYQGVTLGALNFPRDEDGNIVRGRKRHPTIEDGVVIYAEATILGGDTVVGAHSEIGGNVWLTHSVPPGSRVVAPAKLELREPRPSPDS
jgi:serine O-acetyltransferase